MSRYRKATALLQYSIVIAIVALAMATMNIYLKRTLQAKIKTMTDVMISNRQLGSLNDPTTEKYTKTTTSDYQLTQNNLEGGSVEKDIFSSFLVEMDHEVESVEKVDYGRDVLALENPAVGYVLYSDTQTAQDAAERVDSLEEASVGTAENQEAGQGSGTSLGDNIFSGDAQATGRSAGGGTMPFFSNPNENNGGNSR